MVVGCSCSCSCSCSCCCSCCVSCSGSCSCSCRLSFYLSIFLSIYLLSIYLSMCKLENEAVLREFRGFWTWQQQNRGNSPRLPQFFKLTTPKARHFCKTSFKNGMLSAELTASHQCVLRFFRSTCLRHGACHEKVMPSHTKCCTCHAKSP